MVAYSFQRRFIAPICVGLGIPWINAFGVEPPNVRPKTQTIRAVGKRRHARKDEMLQLYYAMRTKQCRQIGTGKCSGAGGIRIFIEKGRIDVEGEKIVKTAPALDAFALGDGFADWYDMREFWRENHGDVVRLGPFVGVLIKWESPR